MARPFTGKHSFKLEDFPQANGTIYVYRVETWYDQETKNTKRKKELIGKKIAEGEEIIPTRPKTNKKVNNAPMKSENTFNAMLAICELICSISGVTEEVKLALPDERGIADKILTLVWYDFLNDGDNWTGAYNWTKEYLQLLPYKYNAISENIYQELFTYLGENSSVKWSIFKARASKIGKGELIAWDSSTYVCGVKDVSDSRTAKHKDGLYHDVYKVFYIYSITSRQLIAYAKISGEVADSSTFKYALSQLKTLNLKNVEIVMDNGYYSNENIGELLHQRQHFLTRMKPSNGIVKPIVDKAIALLKDGDAKVERIPFAPDYCGYSEIVSDKFKYTRVKGSKKKNLKAGDEDYVEADISVFVYYSSLRKGVEDQKYWKKYTEVESDLYNGVYIDDEAKRFSEKYMEVTRVNGKVTSVLEKKTVRESEFKYHGILVLVADKEKDVVNALRKYRLREKEEECIKGHKSHCGGDTSKTGKDEFLDGELLVEFLSNSLRESFLNRINKIERELGVPNGDSEHDKIGNLKIERSLLNWLRKTSLINILKTFKTISVQTIKDSSGHSYKLVSPMSKRNELFLKCLGIKIQT